MIAKIVPDTPNPSLRSGLRLAGSSGQRATTLTRVATWLEFQPLACLNSLDKGLICEREQNRDADRATGIPSESD